MVNIRLVFKPLSGPAEGKQIVVEYENPHIEYDTELTDTEIFHTFVNQMNGTADDGYSIEIRPEHIATENTAHTAPDDVEEEEIVEYLNNGLIDWYSETLDWHEESSVL